MYDLLIDRYTDRRRIALIMQEIDAYVTSYGYGIVRALVGHGIGTKLHEEPQIPNFAQRRKGVRLQPGMTMYDLLIDRYTDRRRIALIMQEIGRTAKTPYQLSARRQRS